MQSRETFISDSQIFANNRLGNLFSYVIFKKREYFEIVIFLYDFLIFFF